MSKDEVVEYKCPNCGESVDPSVNGYCSDCSELFTRWGLFSHIDIDGNLSNGLTL